MKGARQGRKQPRSCARSLHQQCHKVRRTSITRKAGLVSNQKRTIENGAGRPHWSRAMKRLPDPCRGGIAQVFAIEDGWICRKENHRGHWRIHVKNRRKRRVAFRHGHAEASILTGHDGQDSPVLSVRSRELDLNAFRTFLTAWLRRRAQGDLPGTQALHHRLPLQCEEHCGEHQQKQRSEPTCHGFTYCKGQAGAMQA